MDEYISREAAIKALYEVYEHDYPTASGDFDEYARHDVRNVLNGLPSADVQPVKHGHWVEKEAYEEDRQMGFNFQIVCSNCDEQNSVLYFDENSEPTEKYFMRTPWCPWCGARMKSDNNE